MQSCYFDHPDFGCACQKSDRYSLSCKGVCEHRRTEDEVRRVEDLERRVRTRRSARRGYLRQVVS